MNDWSVLEITLHWTLPPHSQLCLVNWWQFQELFIRSSLWFWLVTRHGIQMLIGHCDTFFKDDWTDWSAGLQNCVLIGQLIFNTLFWLVSWSSILWSDWSEQQLWLVFVHATLKTGWSLQFLRHLALSWPAPPGDAEVGRLGAALDTNVSDQHHPQTILLPTHLTSWLLAWSPGAGWAGGERSTTEPASSRSCWTYLLRVQTRVSVHGLLVLEPRPLPPLQPPVVPQHSSPGPSVSSVAGVEAHLGRSWLYEHRDCDQVTGLVIWTHGYGAGGGDVTFNQGVIILDLFILFKRRFPK